jgi:hypothetical protein
LYRRRHRGGRRVCLLWKERWQWRSLKVCLKSATKLVHNVAELLGVGHSEEGMERKEFLWVPLIEFPFPDTVTERLRARGLEVRTLVLVTEPLLWRCFGSDGRVGAWSSMLGEAQRLFKGLRDERNIQREDTIDCQADTVTP